jgi:hypothetical protein
VNIGGCRMKYCSNSLCNSRSECYATQVNTDNCPLKKAFEAFDEAVKDMWNNPKAMYDYWQQLKSGELKKE